MLGLTVQVSDESHPGPAWPLPAQTSLDGTAAESVAVSSDGRSVLHFRFTPREGEDEAVLVVRGLGAYAPDGTPMTLPGEWTLPIRLPTQAQLARAAQVEPFPPVAVSAGSATFVLEAFSAGDRLVLRYTLPAGVAAVGPIAVTEGGDPLRFENELARDGFREVRFRGFDEGPVRVTFAELLTLGDASDAEGVVLRLELEPPAALTEVEPGTRGYELKWRTTASSGPEVAWVRLIPDPIDASAPASLIVRVRGAFSPQLGSLPAVIIDGRR